MSQLKVSARSNPNAVAGAFAGVVREAGRAEVIVVGAGALNQAVKAVAIARSFFAADDIDLACIPAFDTVQIDGEERTALKLVIEPRGPEGAPAVAPTGQRVASGPPVTTGDASTASLAQGEPVDGLRVEHAPDEDLEDLHVEHHDATRGPDQRSRTATSSLPPPPP